VVVDDRLFKTADLGEWDGPVSPIVINNNLIDVVTTATQPGREASSVMRPKVAPWSLDSQVRTVAAGEPTRITIGSSDARVITVRGTIAAGSPPDLKVRHIDDPATFARTAFIEALRRAGVAVTAPAVRPNSTAPLDSRSEVAALPRVAALRGLDFEQTATYILKVSYNRGAQTQVCLLAVAAGSRNCDAGLPKMAQVLTDAGIDPSGAALVDGTGQPGNYITADSEVQLMTAFARRPDAARWRATLPILGVDGSLAQVSADSPAAGHVAAKTGTNGAADLLNGRFRIATKALGGYITAKSGRELAVTIMVNQAMFDDLDGISTSNNDLGDIAASIWEAY
jgi:D-alanyl-D-alanine carboxypeptidase/D-alanyl-D-alanine-endopeptidase (penicillin-binding protein 4)